MNFRTKVPIVKQKFNTIDYNSRVLLLGSCFAEHIGEKFNYYKYTTFLNPFGIQFHTKAIEKLVTDAINERELNHDDVFLINEQWHCFDAHSRLSNSDKEELIKALNIGLNQTKTFLQSCSHVVITLGTAWVYRFIECDAIVANCHKVPQKQFLKQLLSVSEIKLSLEAIIALIKDVNPHVQFVFTVSPVRHLKDGVVENTRSKAHLVSAIHEVVENENNAYYFPSYEIVMDDLRDYRFYNADMVHPTNMAVDYVWEQFCGSWIKADTMAVMKEVDQIQKGLTHRPFNPESEAHQNFLSSLKQKMIAISSKYPSIQF